MAGLGVPVDLIARVVGIDDLYHDVSFVGAVVMTEIDRADGRLDVVAVARWDMYSGGGHH